MGTNPAVSLPNADAVRAAMKKLDLLVISDNVKSNDSINSGAHVLLPAHAWGEKSGTVTNSERRISRQRGFLNPPGQAKADWWIVSEVAKRLGYAAAFAYTSAADIFREHAALSAFENNGSRDFDIGAMTSIPDDGFDAMAPFLWPMPDHTVEPQPRFFAGGRYYTSDRKGHFIAPDVPSLRGATSEARPLRLNTGRIRDQWHTMTRTGLSPRLGQHLPEPYVEIHPADAAQADITDGGHARLATDLGQCVLKVVVSERQQRGMLFAPIHWSEENSASARVGALVAPFTDPFSGQPENKATPVAIEAVTFAQRGFVLSRKPISFPKGVWWSRVAVTGGYGYLLASNLDMANWKTQLSSQDRYIAEYEDVAQGIYRAAQFDGDRLEAVLFIGPADNAPDWDAVKAAFAAEAISDDQRRLLLSGKSADGIANDGPVVCACFGVGRNTICGAISEGARTAQEIGVKLKAGTNCGSCIPELKRLIAQTDVPQPLEASAAS
jgi:assimilatory nitrate reductase catalytic subunit